MGKYLQNPLILIFTTLIVIFFVFSSQHSIKNYQKTSKNIEIIEQENKEIQQNITDLQQKKAFSESEFAKEKIIRDELLLQKPGEYILQLPANLPPAPSPSPSPSPKPVEEWRRLILN